MNQERMYQVLLSPHVSEKSSLLADEQNQHVFKVLPSATKTEVKQAVEKLFDVEVDAVRVTNVKGKTKRTGARMGRRVDWKKAYVRVKAGQTIDFAGE